MSFIKKYLSFFIFFNFIFNFSYSQTIGCTELLDYIVKNGYLKSSISNYTLNSSWLYKVTAYEYEYKTYVVAEIKEKEYYKINSYKIHYTLVT